MRNKKMIFALVAGGLALATTNLMAQGDNLGLPTNSQPQSGQLDQYPKHSDPARSSPAAAANTKVSSIIGLTVRNDSGERLGKVRDLIVNLDTHSTPFAIIEYGGALGIGQTRVAIPLTDLKWYGEPRQLIATATKEQLDTASTTPTGEWMTFQGEDWMKNVDRFYGQPPAANQAQFERQETSGMREGREPVRGATQPNGASQLLDQVPATSPGAENRVTKSTDEVITAKVNSLIRSDVGDRAGEVVATLEKGVVTLNGKVASDEQKKVLEEHIKAVPGVDRVENNLVTRTY